MNALTKKFIISILSIVFAVIMLGTVTYAWFSIAATNVLHNLSLSVSTGDEFQISLDGVNYHKTITSTEIMQAIGNELELIDVTSTDGINFLSGGPLGITIPEKNVNYFSLTFYFRTTRVQRHVYLVDNVSHIARYDEGKDGTYVVSRGINWKADNTFRNGEGEEDIVKTGDRDIYYAANAIRITFIEEKIVENELDNRNNNELTRKMFNLNSDPKRGFGVKFGSLDYYNVKHNKNIQPPTYIPNTITELTEFAHYNPYVPLDDSSYILELKETSLTDEENQTYYKGKVTVNVWLEGWDADCFNSIFTDLIKIQLKFKAGNQYIE